MRGAQPIEAKINRLAGMSEDRRQAMNEHLAKQADWRVTCRHCGHTMKGTLQEIKRCGCQTAGRLPEKPE